MINKEGEVFVKDMTLVRFCEKFPEYASKVLVMRAELSVVRRHYLVDLMVMNCFPGRNSCRDIRWHFDGDYYKDNVYVLNVTGPNRTEFLNEDIVLSPPCERKLQGCYLASILVGCGVLSIEDGKNRVYDSRTPHRGVLCNKVGIRVFLRLLASDYIMPKNILKRGFDVPF